MIDPDDVNTGKFRRSKKQTAIVYALNTRDVKAIGAF